MPFFIDLKKANKNIYLLNIKCNKNNVINFFYFVIYKVHRAMYNLQLWSTFRDAINSIKDNKNFREWYQS